MPFATRPEVDQEVGRDTAGRFRRRHHDNSRRCWSCHDADRVLSRAAASDFRTDVGVGVSALGVSPHGSSPAPVQVIVHAHAEACALRGLCCFTISSRRVPRSPKRAGGSPRSVCSLTCSVVLRRRRSRSPSAFSRASRVRGAWASETRAISAAKDVAAGRRASASPARRGRGVHADRLTERIGRSRDASAASSRSSEPGDSRRAGLHRPAAVRRAASRRARRRARRSRGAGQRVDAASCGERR